MIKFWRTTDEYGCFSNFSRHPIEADGKWYSTTEHYYQSKKATTPEDAEKVRMASTAKFSKQIAQKIPLRADWENVKQQVMFETLMMKVEQYPEIKDKLLATGDAQIIEDSPFDYIWGCGADGSGQNLLGKLWMQVRMIVRAQSPPAGESKTV